MITRNATCSCGQLHLVIEGEASRISMCHCLECQRRTGAVISNQARFRREQVTFTGKAMVWKRTAESGNALTFHFCPTCGSTVYWESEGFPGYVAVAIGNFADPNFPAPTMGLLAARHAAQTRGEAGMIKQPGRIPATNVIPTKTFSVTAYALDGRSSLRKLSILAGSDCSTYVTLGTPYGRPGKGARPLMGWISSLPGRGSLSPDHRQ